MSTNKDLFKEAIADAKQVREAALVNAKAALEEALTPKLHSMLAAKLEEMNDNDEEETLEEVDYISANDKRNDSDMIRKRAIDASQMSEGEEELEEDFDLSAILAELDSEESIDEAKKEDEEKMDEAKEETEDEESEEETEIEDETEEDSKITDLTVDELKDIIKDIISAEMGAEAGMEMGAEDEMDMAGEEEMAVDLDGEDAGMEMGSEDDEIDEVDLDELLAELDALDETDDMDKDDMYEAKKKDAKKEDEKDEMKEAIETIETLRAELHEQNLLNAKLLYVNKIFKAKNLTESQKIKVIASFDKATTPKQAKELFESIQNSEIGAKKGIVKESLGFASKAAGVAPKKVIVESNDVIARMQKLANIK
jgi:hypothetical protein